MDISHQHAAASDAAATGVRRESHGHMRPQQGCVLFDELGMVIYATDTVNGLLGLSAGAVCPGMPLTGILLAAFSQSDWVTCDARNWIHRSSAAFAGSSSYEGASAMLADGDGHSVGVTLNWINAQCRIAVFDDITMGSQTDQFAAGSGFKDPLTGIGNRALLEGRLDEVLSRMNRCQANGVTILFLDLDRFKIINDTLGHATGDALLRLVTGRLQGSLRPSDTLARMGGDEFAMILTGSDGREAVSALASRIIDLIQRTYLIDGQIVNVGVSIGIAVAPRDGLTREEILKSADLALYQSKVSGRGMFHFFEPEMAEIALRRRALECDLRKALILRQLELHYQPQIDSESQSVCGLEALLRWRHPQRGLLLPSSFIALAEEIGLAVPIGEWVLQNACREATRWPASVTIAVNISPLHFESGKLAASVERALRNADLPSSRLEIEVTEEILLKTGASVLSTLNALRELGVSVAMDRFGTGIASLSQLVKFPFDRIKIDQSLMAERQDDAKSRAIVRAISALGQSLGISTIAAGVETIEQLERVRLEGCSSVQGFYYSKALTAGELNGLCASLFQQSTTVLVRTGVQYEQ